MKIVKGRFTREGVPMIIVSPFSYRKKKRWSSVEVTTRFWGGVGGVGVGGGKGGE